MIVDVCDIGLKNIDFTTPFYPIRQRKARVVGNYVYMVNLEIENTMLKKYSCACPDANEGCKCKHILATCMEILDPHKPSTEKKKEEMRKAQENLKKERQKKRIYNETYYDGLRLLNNYSEDMLTFNISKNENTLDINNIYADTIIEDYSKMKNNATLDENIIIEPRIVELGNDCLKVSFKIGTKMMYSLKEINNFAVAFKNKKILNLGKKLNFVADAKNFDEKSPKILKPILDGAKDIENYGGGSGKLDQCIDILREAMAIDSGHKILLFYQYTSMFDILEERLKKMDVKYFKLTGETAVDKRIDMVDEFNKNSEIKIFLISLKACGTGLNLTGADVVIHYDPWWNLSAENQATDRAYRIGQKNSVQVYKLIANNSIEERINELQEKKSKLSEELLSTEETFINKLSKQEIMSLFE